MAIQKSGLPPTKQVFTRQIIHETVPLEGSDFHGELDNKTKSPPDLQKILNQLRTMDIRMQLIIRGLISGAFLCLLFWQNYQVFSLITLAFQKSTVKDLQPILGIIITGTLAETYFVIKEIVKWVLTPIDYTEEKNKEDKSN